MAEFQLQDHTAKSIVAALNSLKNITEPVCILLDCKFSAPHDEAPYYSEIAKELDLAIKRSYLNPVLVQEVWIGRSCWASRDQFELVVDMA